MTTKIITGLVVIGAILGTIAFVGFSPFQKTVIEQFGSTAGTTGNTGKRATIVWAPQSSTATTTSILNTDASDRVIISMDMTCAGIGASGTALTSAGLVVTAATSSTANPGAITNTNLILLTTNTFATSTAELFQATSSPGLTGVAANVFVRRWASGSYLTFSLNGTQPNATCTIGASYLPN